MFYLTSKKKAYRQIGFLCCGVYLQKKSWFTNKINVYLSKIIDMKQTKHKKLDYQISVVASGIINKHSFESKEEMLEYCAVLRRMVHGARIIITKCGAEYN